jgi:hypothetical protein
MFSVNPKNVGEGVQRELNTLWRTLLPYCGAFYNDATIANGSTTVAQTVALPDTWISKGVSITNSTEIRFKYAGVYDVAFSAQLNKASGSAADVDIWIAVNGTDVPSTNTRVTLQGSSAKLVAAWDYMIQVEAGDYAELKWFSSSLDVQIAAFTGLTSPTRPDVPSVIVSVLPVLGLRPRG